MEVKNEVLPPPDLRMFWDRPQAAARLAKIVSQSPASAHHFELPRRGTRMKVRLEICDSLIRRGTFDSNYKVRSHAQRIGRIGSANAGLCRGGCGVFERMLDTRART